jgi:tetratricopeptide (TPR) repeat protein
LQQLQRVLQSDKLQSLARFLTGVLAADKDKTEEAIGHFQEVLGQEPNHFGVHYCLANLFFNAAAYEKAAEHYRKALLANPDIPPARLYQLLASKLSGTPDADLIGPLEALSAAHPEQQILRYVLIRMLILSDDTGVRDPERARRLVNDLVQQAFIPPHVELQALVAAVIGNFEQAAELQRQVLPAMLWIGEEVYQRAQPALNAYERNEMPAATWYQEDLMLQPPRVDALLLFREYPSPVPY